MRPQCTTNARSRPRRTWSNQLPRGLPGDELDGHYFVSLVSSADGSLLVADLEDAYNEIYLSRDFGATWVDDNARSITPVFCSADGTVVVTEIDYDVAIQLIPPPLAIAPKAGTLTLSWPAPSREYTLQQVSDLASTNWVAVTNAITVTNYRNNVTVVPPVGGNVFYRLLGPGH